MADTRLYIQAQKFTLAIGISTSDTSITLTSFNLPDGTAIAAGDVGSINYGTLEPGTTREEQISFTGFTTNGDGTVTLTGVTRGLGFGASNTYSEQADLKVQHGAGATFIISNTAAFYDEFVNKYNDETISGTLTVPTPTSGGHAVTKDYADGLVVGGLAQNKVAVAGTAGESVAAGDLVYFDDTDNEWKKADADVVATIDNVLLGIAQGSGSDGVAITDGVLLYGLDENQTGLTAGTVYYVSNTAGEISASAGTNEKIIGWGQAATGLYFDPYHGGLPSRAEKAALAGAGAAPSTSNKFLTEGDIDDNTIFVPPTVEVFTTSGTWTKDAGLKYVVVEGTGGGGGGGGDEGTGGGAGGYFRKLILASALGATETVTIGAAGTGENSSGTGGSNGGNTSFGSILTGNGGTKAGAGGTATGGDINITGGVGSRATSGTGGNWSQGGSNLLGVGGGSSTEAGTGYGAGGAGGATSNAGGAGTAGIIIVTEYYS